MLAVVDVMSSNTKQQHRPDVIDSPQRGCQHNHMESHAEFSQQHADSSMLLAWGLY